MGRSKIRMATRSWGSYPARIVDWKVNYSIGLDKEHRFSESFYREDQEIEIRSEFLGPDKIKGREVRIVFLPEEALAQTAAIRSSVQKPGAVGYLTSRRENSNFVGSVPFQSCDRILGLLQCGKAKYVILDGEALRYGRAAIDHVTLTGEFDPENY